ncbi:hypothetical protein ACJIZ3_025367 [Penstemon smallii]|uniref:Uncharacterized protein n=1 Tax=Penstemon smallii TaxID=265156 RepID=A0ABD3TVR9_9LAMI
MEPVIDKLASATMAALARREKIESQIKEISKNVSYIMDLLNDAEAKQITNSSIKDWLDMLHHLTYDLDDVLDEIITLSIIQEKKDIKHEANWVWKCIPTCSTRFTPNALKSNYRLMSKMDEVTKQLQLAVKRETELNLRSRIGLLSSRPYQARYPSSAVVNESHVHGRDDDKKAIRELLLASNPSSQHNVSAILIVGMGGIGKTTLAQLVYRDKLIKQNFDVKAWICVSGKFDLHDVAKEIFMYVTGESGDSMSFNMLQLSLEEKLSEKKFLIVLDNFWHEDSKKWDVLFETLQVGLRGSRILITTRNDKFDSVMDPGHVVYRLKLLHDDDCGALLAQASRRSLHGDFQEVGQSLVRKCKGLPLAARALGSLLKYEETKEEWENVLNSQVWDLPEENSILPVLRLSYHHLPSDMKHLFSYCSIFPKDYEFGKNELVYLWMGEGFLETPKVGQTKEQLGIMCFNELLSRSFFQPISGSDSIFVMHDLINDLAQSVAGGTCYRVDEKMDNDLEYSLPEKVRHASFPRHKYEVFHKLKGFLEVRSLRTFLPMPVQKSGVCHLSDKILFELVPELRSLRVLSLSRYFIKEVPSSICNLILLRYLNLSGTSIVTLPDFLSDLVRLETLSLCDCILLSNLPPSLGNISSLRHLDNSNTQQLKDMPVEIGKLENLQTLPKIVLAKEGGLGMKELQNLKLLNGKLAVFELQNVRNVEDVEKASLRHKKLDDLQLTWGNDIDNSRNKSSEEEVIDFLKPDQNLRKLNIEFYGGGKFPIWIGDPVFSKLSIVILRGCAECASLPPLGQLPELKELHIRDMPKIKHIGVEFYGIGLGIPFPKLEILRFDGMTGWEKWSSFSNDEADHIQFPNLNRLALLKCQGLTDVSPLSFPVLREVDLEECNMAVLESFQNLKSLIYLRVESIAHMCNLPAKLVHSLASLEVFECCSCKDLLSLWPSEIPLDYLIRLRRLIIEDCSKLASLGEGVPSNLEALEIYRCANLTSLPNELNNLRSLRDLVIKHCPKFVNFPADGVPPMLKRLEIFNCNALESLTSNLLNLEMIEIKACSSLKRWATPHFPADLKYLSIKNCTELDSLSERMFPQGSRMSLERLSLCDWFNSESLLHRLKKFSNLVELYLSCCYSLTHLPEEGLPPNLRSLSIEDCANLRSIDVKIQGMRSLLSLEIHSCRRLESFPECDLPRNLSTLKISHSKKLKNLSEWGLHRLTSLREFSISGGFKELELIGDREGIFPPSLIKLSIGKFPKLSSLSKVLDGLTLLRHLSVVKCAKLHDLPCDQVLEKLFHLKISRCAVLSTKCVKKRGPYWSKIYGIPCVEIDGTSD